MEINFRDPSIKYPLGIRDDKTLIVLDWLLEFRFSSYDVLASRIDSTATNSNRFFRLLVERGMIKTFKSAYATGRKFVMLDSNGVGFLESRGRAVEKATIRASRVGNYSNLMHDIAIQHIVLHAIESQREKSTTYTDVWWDRHIEDLENDVRPDAMLKTSNGQMIAFEVERYRKEQRKIYYKFRLHADSILEGKYRGVLYFFLKDSDRAFYEKLCLASSWPFVEKRKSDRGKLTARKEMFVPADRAEKLQDCFTFAHSPLMDISKIA